jgi:hypothetical protein
MIEDINNISSNLNNIYNMIIIFCGFIIILNGNLNLNFFNKYSSVNISEIS